MFLPVCHGLPVICGCCFLLPTDHPSDHGPLIQMRRGYGCIRLTPPFTSKATTSNQRVDPSAGAAPTPNCPPRKHCPGRGDPFTEGFVYPGLGGSTSAQKGRQATISEASYLSDAPHLDYKTPCHNNRQAIGALNSPSHIRMDLRAVVEVAD